MNNNELISIIIPAYNASKYINRCLESIIVQDYKFFEIIIINDGSTDNTLDICNDFINDHDEYNILCVTQDNRGVSAARNRGIQMSKGKYLTFIDSDDTIEKNYLTKLIEMAIKDNSDFVVSNSRIIKKKGNEYTKIIRNKPIIDEKKAYIASEFNNKYSYINYGFFYSFSRNLCGKLYNREIIKKNNILLDEGIFLFEDGFFNLQYVLKANKISFINEFLYNYYIEEGQSSRYRENLEIENIYKMNRIDEVMNMYSINLQIAKELYYFDLFTGYIINYINYNEQCFKMFEKHKILKKIIREKVYGNIIDNKKFKYLNLKKKLIFILLRLKLYDVVILVLSKRRK